MSFELPRPRTPLSQRRCTCIWEPGYRTGRRLVDPSCPSAVLHVDDDERISLAVDALLTGAGAPPAAPPA